MQLLHDVIISHSPQRPTSLIVAKELFLLWLGLNSYTPTPCPQPPLLSTVRHKKKTTIGKVSLPAPYKPYKPFTRQIIRATEVLRWGEQETRASKSRPDQIRVPLMGFSLIKMYAEPLSWCKTLFCESFWHPTFS